MSTNTTSLRVRGLHVQYRVRESLFRRRRTLQAVNGVDLDLRPGETLGLVGESGSGKSTVARAIMGLAPIHRGTIEVGETDITTLSRSQRRPYRRKVQMVFQDPYSSLDPSATIASIIGEPLRVHFELNRAQREDRVVELLDLVGLPSESIERYPHEFSGGQRQRIAIARAIALDPEILLLDEAVSALDVSTQNQVLGLLAKLRVELGMSLLFISHDLSVVRWISDRIAVMYMGEAVETGSAEDLTSDPHHPYTAALLASAPDVRRGVRGDKPRSRIEGDIPDPTSPPSGCAFHPRCPKIMDECSSLVPPPFERSGGGTVSCLLYAGHTPGSPRGGDDATP